MANNWLIIVTLILTMLFLFLLLSFGIATTIAKDDKLINVVCYFVNGYGVTIAPPETLDPKLCTHILYAFVNLDISGNLTYQRKEVDIDKGMYKRVVSLKKINPALKVLLSVSGDKSIFSRVAMDDEKRQNLANSAVNFCKSFGFDGLDIDWEKPSEEDEDNFVDLLKDLRNALDEGGWLLSTAVYPYPYSGYNATGITKYVHMLNVMCYNYYGPWSQYTGFNSPLFGSSIESDYEKRHLNIANSIKNWIEAGATKAKINVGIPFYGRTFTLVNPQDHGVHAPILGAGIPASPSYSTICTTFNNYTYVWDDEQKVPYKYYGSQWLTYENERSIAIKTKYIVSQNVGGIMIWQIGQDDMKGDCGQKQGLLRIINDNLNVENITTN
ncbi:unnamed protein product [Psylliodes chrysocephalus]|uniref:GH18 domain-containing protein n=1 Tax=Psylliodes chrysocephalus TaxID=3402493 RepID=A0A9P0G9V8_9CUCU|nr:unnamed protein product [Psylliodes chrysocephala]